MISIRRFTPDDQQSVKALITGIMDSEFGDQKMAYPDEDLKDIPRYYGGIGEAFYVASANGKVIGSIAIKKEDDRVALMRRLFVAKEYRKQKVGLQLIERAIKFCHEVGFDELVFRTTSHMVGAAKLCQKRGFVLRAKLQLGDVELLKFVLSLRGAGRDAKTALTS